MSRRSFFGHVLFLFLFFAACSKAELLWENDLGETLKVQTRPLILAESGTVVTWAVDIGRADENRFVIPRVNTSKPGVHMSADNKVFKSYLAAFDIHTGARVWESPRLGGSDQNTSSPVVFEDTIYVGSDDASLKGIDAGGGQIIFELKAAGWVHLAPYADRDSLVFADEEGYLYFYQREPLKLLRRTRPGYSDKDFFCDGIVVLYSTENKVIQYDIMGNRNGVFESSDKFTDFNGIEKRSARIKSGVAAGGGYGYFATEGGFVHKIRLKGMSEVWTTHLKGATEGTPLIYGDTLVVATDKGAALLSTGSGKVERILLTDNRWMDYDLRFRKGGAVNGGFSVHDGVVYFGSRDYAVYGYDMSDGKRVFRYSIKHHIDRTVPAVASGVVIFGADSHHLYGVDIREK